MAKEDSGRTVSLQDSLQRQSLNKARFASAEEIGDFIAVLVSDKQGGMGWMVGSDIVIDGGENTGSVRWDIG